VASFRRQDGAKAPGRQRRRPNTDIVVSVVVNAAQTETPLFGGPGKKTAVAETLQRMPYSSPPRPWTRCGAAAGEPTGGDRPALLDAPIAGGATARGEGE